MKTSSQQASAAVELIYNILIVFDMFHLKESSRWQGGDNSQVFGKIPGASMFVMPLCKRAIRWQWQHQSPNNKIESPKPTNQVGEYASVDQMVLPIPLSNCPDDSHIDCKSIHVCNGLLHWLSIKANFCLAAKDSNGRWNHQRQNSIWEVCPRQGCQGTKLPCWGRYPDPISGQSVPQQRPRRNLCWSECSPPSRRRYFWCQQWCW